jgi:hypothetical protein
MDGLQVDEVVLMHVRFHECHVLQHIARNLFTLLMTSTALTASIRELLQDGVELRFTELHLPLRHDLGAFLVYAGLPTLLGVVL